MEMTIDYRLDAPIATGEFEARGCEVFFKRFNAKYGHLVCICPTEMWARRMVDRINAQVNGGEQPDIELVDFRTVNLTLD